MESGMSKLCRLSAVCLAALGLLALNGCHYSHACLGWGYSSHHNEYYHTDYGCDSPYTTTYGRNPYQSPGYHGDYSYCPSPSGHYDSGHHGHRDWHCD